jgi:hypothetical protein
MEEQAKEEKASQLSMFPDVNPSQKTSPKKPNKLKLDVPASQSPK